MRLPSTLIFRSEDSGSPAYTEDLEVRLDACRQIVTSGYLPVSFELEPTEFVDHALVVAPFTQPLIADVDVAVKTTVESHGTPARYQVLLKAPSSLDFRLLKHENTPTIPAVWDDETNPPETPLGDLDSTSSTGPWTLRIENVGQGILSGQLQRFDVRLHHEEQPPCVN